MDSQEARQEVETPKRQTLYERLLIRRKNLEAKLGSVNEALDKLRENPEIEQSLDLFARAMR